MSCYFIAHIRIKDDLEYQKYIDRAGEIFARYRGEYLAVDDHPEVVEGEWDYTRAVLIRFDSKSDFKAWYHSEDYREILKHRLNASESDAILIEDRH
ncbi:MAG: DUF1330 domain-containing protein [Bacteroidales bacterium]